MEAIIPENDDNLFPKCDTVLPGTQRTKKGMTKKEHNIKMLSQATSLPRRKPYHL